MAVTVTGLYILCEVRDCGEEVSSCCRKFAKSDYYPCHASTAAARNTSVPAGQIFVNSFINSFLLKSVEKNSSLLRVGQRISGRL